MKQLYSNKDVKKNKNNNKTKQKKLYNPWDFSGSPVFKTSPPNAGGADSIPGKGAKIPHASQSENQNIKQKQYCYKFNKDFKKWSTSKKTENNYVIPVTPCVGESE